jgi:hypothetical protein
VASFDLRVASFAGFHGTGTEFSGLGKLPESGAGSFKAFHDYHDRISLEALGAGDAIGSILKGISKVTDCGNGTKVIKTIAPQAKPSDKVDKEINARSSRVCLVPGFCTRIESGSG